MKLIFGVKMNLEENSESVTISSTNLISTNFSSQNEKNSDELIKRFNYTDILNDLRNINTRIYCDEQETFRSEIPNLLLGSQTPKPEPFEDLDNSLIASRETERETETENVPDYSRDNDVKDESVCKRIVDDFRDDSLDNEIKKESPEDKVEGKEPQLSETIASADTRRTRRVSKRKRDAEECCPVCGLTLRLSDLESHYIKEVENLSKITRNPRKSSGENQGINTTFVQVKSNRENRLSAKVTRYSTKDRNTAYCPLCKLRLENDQREITRHILNCIVEDSNSDDYLVVDGDDYDEYEEYEFADQTRVRTISMIPGGYRSLEGVTSRIRPADDEEEVDVDNTLTFGDPQYTELDLIHNTKDNADNKELEQLRRAVLLDPNVQPNVLESRKWSSKDEKSCAFEQCSRPTDNQSMENSKMEGKSSDVSDSNLISSLKERIKDLEEQNRNVKCLICLESYTKPLVSTTCWHVHCEECWLMTMGVKKLCPQCNMIVFPSDLRRIFL